MVVAKFDVGLNQVLNRWVGPAQHEVLARAFQIVIDDLKWPGAVPSGDRLRIGADLVDVGDVRINYRRAGGIDHYAAPRVISSVAVNIAAVNDQIMRRLRQ